MTTYAEARDEMFKVFTGKWATLTFTAYPTGPYPVVWDDVGAVPPANAPWARLTLRHGSVSQSLGPIGGRRFEQTGTLFIQLFAPLGDGLKTVYAIAHAIAEAYRNAQTCVMFRRVRIQEIGARGEFEQINVLTDFVYDEVA